MSSSHKIITVSKLLGEPSALSASSIAARTVVLNLNFEHFLLPSES